MVYLIIAVLKMWITLDAARQAMLDEAAEKTTAKLTALLAQS